MTDPVLRSTDEMHVESSMVSTGPGFITQSGTPSEEQFQFIRENFGDPRASNVKPTDYYAFRMIASGDGLDSYFTRQDVATSFANFVRDLRKGQSVLGNHKVDSFTYGSSFAGEIIPADESRSEYEGTFYPQWDTPELRTKQWLVGDYYITRGVTLNGQSSDDLVRSIELGGVRKASISFMVGQYVCGIDGYDLMNTMFGPMPTDEACTHFPGVAYEGQIAWALMKNNTLVETSLVYKNASPSSMLLRKAETLAERGALSVKDISQLENRFQVRLPRFERSVYPVIPVGNSTASNTTTSGTTNASKTWQLVNGSQVYQLTSAGPDTSSITIQGMEETDMAKRSSGDATARALAREALTAELEPEQEETVELEGATEVVEPLTSETPATGASDDTADRAAATEDSGEATDAVAEVDDEAGGASEEAATETSEGEVAESASDEETRVVADEDRHKGHTHEGDSKGGHKKSKPVEAGDDGEAEGDGAGEAPAVVASESTEAPADEEEEPKSDSTREEDAVAAFLDAADRLASALARNPDAFDSGQLAVAARAERAVDLALIDAGCDTTVGGHVARTFETRSKTLREALGEPLTVEAIRSLQSKATLGETLYEELVKDAVAARTGAQGESFNAPKYRDLLMAARDVAYVKEEIESWKDAKKDRFTPGRSVVPRQVADARPSKDERKTLPEAPNLTALKAVGSGTSTNIFEPRKK